MNYNQCNITIDDTDELHFDSTETNRKTIVFKRKRANVKRVFTVNCIEKYIKRVLNTLIEEAIIISTENNRNEKELKILSIFGINTVIDDDIEEWSPESFCFHANYEDYVGCPNCDLTNYC